MQISKIALVCILIAFFAVGLIGGRLLLKPPPAPTLGHPPAPAQESQETAPEHPHKEPAVPAASLQTHPPDEPEHPGGEIMDQPDPAGGDEVIMADGSHYLSVSDGDPEESRAVATVIRCADRYIDNGRIVNADTVVFAQSSVEKVKQPIVLTRLEYDTITALLDTPGSPSAVEVRKLAVAQCRNVQRKKVLADFVFKRVIASMAPSEADIAAVFNSVKNMLENRYPQYGGLNESMKNSIRLYCIREQFLTLVLSSCERLLQSGNLSFNRFDLPVPWRVEGSSYEDGFGERPPAARLMSKGTIGSEDSLFVIDGRSIVVSELDSSLGSIDIPLVQLPGGESLYDDIVKLAASMGEREHRLVHWLDNFTPRYRDRIAEFVILEIVRRWKRDGQFASGGSDDVEVDTVRPEMKLASLINATGYIADVAQVYLQKELAQAIRCVPTMMDVCAEAGFNAYVVHKFPLFDLTWILLQGYASGMERVDIYPRDVLASRGYSGEFDVVKTLVIMIKKGFLISNILFVVGDGMTTMHVGMDEESLLRQLFTIRLEDRLPYGMWRGRLRGIYLGDDPYHTAKKQNTLDGGTAPRDTSFSPEIDRETPAAHRLLPSAPGAEEKVKPDTVTSASPKPPAITSGYITDEQVEDFYHRFSSLFATGRQYRFGILFHPDKNIVQKAVEELKTGVSFDKAVTRYAIVQSRKYEQVLIPEELLKPELSKVLETLDVNDVSDIVDIRSPGEGYALLQLLSRRESRAIPFEHRTVKDMCREYYLAEKVNTEFQTQIARGGGYIKRYKRWIWPVDSVEGKKLLTAAAALVDSAQVNEKKR